MEFPQDFARWVFSMTKRRKPHMVYSVVVNCKETGQNRTYFIEGKFGKSSQNKALKLAISDGMKKPEITSAMLEHPNIFS